MFKSQKKSESGSNRTKRGFLARLRSDSRGNTLAIAGAALVPIAAMIGSGLDMSRAYMAQAKLQNACDAAALAARREMSGTDWTTSAEAEGRRFFDFNFPASTMNAQNVSATIAQSATDSSTVEVVATADIPTTIMGMFGKDFMPISVECDADQDYGNNDIMVVLDVTGSMRWSPSTGGGSKISMLRSAAIGLYRALAGASNTRTRFGIMPYSMTVNVGADLSENDVLRDTYYWQKRAVCTRYRRNGRCRSYSDVYDLWDVNVNDTPYTNINNWRNNGRACIEERPTIGNPDHRIEIEQAVSRDDIDLVARNAVDRARQWGRYDTAQAKTRSGYSISPSACPDRASRLREYSSESAFQSAINSATATVAGNTYHDIGMMWGMRYLSSTGMFARDNPTEWNGVPVAKHIVYLTDGNLQVSTNGYSAYGYEREGKRLQGSQSQNDRHIAHFLSACSRARAMGMTVWVIALDVTNTDEIEPCATSSGHFYTSDGSDLEAVFTQIGQGIGRLRLTQ